MKKIQIFTLVLVLLVLAFLFAGRSSKVEAPLLSQSNQLVSVGSTQVADVKDVKEFTVTGKNFSFSPSLITVKKGDRVKITFKNDSGFHDFKVDEYGLATKQTKSPSTEILEFTAEKIGSFEYYCSVSSHRSMGMKGILKVE